MGLLNKAKHTSARFTPPTLSMAGARAPTLPSGDEARKRNAAARRALGLISPEWAKRLRRKGIAVGNATPLRLNRRPGRPYDGPISESPPIRPMVVVDVGARGLTPSQFRAR
jgi:hypothetical protein